MFSYQIVGDSLSKSWKFLHSSDYALKELNEREINAPSENKRMA